MTLRYLTPNQLAKALHFWDDLKLDTLKITIRLKLPEQDEHVVYRSLSEHRDRQYRLRAIARRMAS